CAMRASADARACFAFNTCAWAARSWASVSGDERVATTCPAVTSSPSSTVNVASRPGYLDETSTCVASMRPFDFTIPSGIVRPRSRAIRVSTWDRNCSVGLFCAGWPCEVLGFDCACAVGRRSWPSGPVLSGPQMASAKIATKAAADDRTDMVIPHLCALQAAAPAFRYAAAGMVRPHTGRRQSAMPRLLLGPMRASQVCLVCGQDAQQVAAGNNAGDAAISDDRHALDPVSDEHTRHLAELGILAHGDNRR